MREFSVHCLIARPLKKSAPGNDHINGPEVPCTVLHLLITTGCGRAAGRGQRKSNMFSRVGGAGDNSRVGFVSGWTYGTPCHVHRADPHVCDRGPFEKSLAGVTLHIRSHNRQ